MGGPIATACRQPSRGDSAEAGSSRVRIRWPVSGMQTEDRESIFHWLAIWAESTRWPWAINGPVRQWLGCGRARTVSIRTSHMIIVYGSSINDGNRHNHD